MAGKIAIKRLTRSDLTFFIHQFRTLEAGNQKSINLNREVFVDELYPSLGAQPGEFPVALSMYGPGLKRELKLARKIVKNPPSYKNWRLNGEFVANPLDDPQRFDVLAPDDIAVFDFTGDAKPEALRIYFVSRVTAEDAALHAGLDAVLLNNHTMRVIGANELAGLVAAAGLDPAHPANALLLDEVEALDVQDAAVGGFAAVQKLQKRSSAVKVTRAQLQAARAKAEQTGDTGEALAFNFLDEQQTAGEIAEARWVSLENAVSPFDFLATELGGLQVRIDAKATTGPFERPFHMSLAELVEAAKDGGRYDIYRLYQLVDDAAMMRVAKDIAPFARIVLQSLAGLPAGVVIDSVSISPASLSFAPEQRVEFAEDEQ